ncbi:unnamed protein product [Cylicocyclus nassatus]|uniref:CHK kinase-like domain-containing protein n=1 Tax=Cylicocyclus nassatus TaxID=53992 RepID=A0AA36DJM4_CYLNA|nr:unnamed protein product [Cylicocyclus nassatus]
MNLYTPGNGLFETHVTWEDIEEDMQRELHTKAFFGPNKTAENIADGIGFMSRIVLINPDWQNADKQLPAKFIVKILTQLLLAKLTAEMGVTSDFRVKFDEPQKMLHNGEVSVYSHLIEYGHENFPIPKIYFMRKFSKSNPVKGYIIMEYLENVKTMKIYNNITVDSVKQVFAAIAILEAMSLQFTPEEKKEFTRPHFEMFHGMFYNEDLLHNCMKSLRTFGNGRLHDKVEKMEGILHDVMDPVVVDQLADNLGMQRVLCHGDLSMANMLWRQNGTEDLTLAAMIDFQAAHMGCPVTDVAAMLILCLSGKDRRKHWEEVLEHLHVNLRKEIGEDMKMPFSLEQLKEAYRLYFPFAGASFLPFIVPIFEIMSKDANEEQKKEYLDALLEKTECILDDTIFYYERNKKKALVRKISQEFDEAELVT